MEYKLRDYQVSNSLKGVDILTRLGIVYYCMEVRSGKTLTALETCRLYGAKNVLFLTKKIAIKGITEDYKNFGFESHFNCLVINDESLHKVEQNDFDLIIHDEHHRFGSFPKPNKVATLFKKRFKHLPMIFLSGTPHPESFSQLFNQFWVSDNSPFKMYNNFYAWFKGYGLVKTEFDRGYSANVPDYSNNIESIYKYISIKKREIPKEDTEKLQSIKKLQDDLIEKMHESNDKLLSVFNEYKVNYTQKEAGFTSVINEHILYVEMKPSTHKMVKKLIRDRILVGDNEVVIADTAVKLQQKCHQLFSGTIKFEPKEGDISGNSMVIDYSKAEFINTRFSGYKIAIFYKFKAEYKALKDIYGDNLTDNLEDFNNSDKCIALQIQSGREGISLKEANYLVYYNLDFSSVSYWQSRDRLTTMDRLSNDVYWVFSRGGIEDKIFKVVQGKKNYTLSAFTKDFINGK